MAQGGLTYGDVLQDLPEALGRPSEYDTVLDDYLGEKRPSARRTLPRAVQGSPEERLAGMAFGGVAGALMPRKLAGLAEQAAAGMEEGAGRALEFAGTFGEKATQALPNFGLDERTRAAKSRSVEAAGEPGRALQESAAERPAPAGYAEQLARGAGGVVPLLGASAINPALGAAALGATAGAGVEDAYTRTLEATGDEAKAVQSAAVQLPLEGLLLAPVVKVMGRLGSTAGGSLWRNAFDGALSGTLGPGSARILGEVAGEQITKEEKADLGEALKRGSGQAVSEVAVSGPLFAFLHAAAGIRAPKKAPAQPEAATPGGASGAPEVAPEPVQSGIPDLPAGTIETRPPRNLPDLPEGTERLPVEDPSRLLQAPKGRFPMEPGPFSPVDAAVPRRGEDVSQGDAEAALRRARNPAAPTQAEHARIVEAAKRYAENPTPEARIQLAEVARPIGPEMAEAVNYVRPSIQEASKNPEFRADAQEYATASERRKLDIREKLQDNLKEFLTPYDIGNIAEWKPGAQPKAAKPSESPKSSSKSGIASTSGAARGPSVMTEPKQRRSTGVGATSPEPVARPPLPTSPPAGEGVRPRVEPQAKPIAEPHSKAPEPATVDPVPVQEAESATGIRNAVVDKERAARGLPPAMEVAAQDAGEWWAKAEERLNENPRAGEELVQKIREEPRPMTPVEDAILLREQIEAQNEHARIADQLTKAAESGDQARIAELHKKAGDSSDRLLRIYEAGKHAGTEWGRSGVARQMMAREDFSLAAMETAIRVEQKGKRLTPADTLEIKRLHEKIAATQKAFDEYVERTERTKGTASQKPAAKAKVLDFMEAQAREARRRIRERGSRAMAGLDPADLADRVIVGADFLAKDIAKFAEWSKAMVGEFGEAIKPHLQDIYDQAKAYLDAAPKKAGALQGFKTRTKGAIEKLEAKADAGDFEPAKRTPLTLDKEGIALKADYEAAKREFERKKLKHRYENRTTGEKWKDWGKEALNLPKALMTAYDFSAVLRQGAFFSLGHPIKTAKALPDMFAAAISERKALEIDVALRARPNAQLGETAKLELTRHGDDIGKHEEAIRSQWSDKIPGIKASNRAFITFLNMQRATAFDAMVDAVPGGATPKQARAIAELVNIGTGRGEPGKFAAAVSAASNVLWSPRLLLSRFQLLAGHPLHGGDMATRKLVAQEYARSITGLAAVYALAKLAGFDVEVDPRSSDFGKLRMGDTRVDPLAGLSQVTVLLSRLTLGETKTLKGKITPIRGKDVPYGQGNSFDVIARFIRSKLSPTLGVSLDLMAGENMVGEEATPASAARNAIVPLAFQDILEAMEDQGVPRGAALSVLGILGMGLSVYEPKKK